MKKVAIYGGSFDPPHNGHLLIAQKLSGIFDETIIMPSFISPFKSRAANPRHRLKMLKTGLKEQSVKAKISGYEIKKGGISYTIDTVLHLCSPNRRLYFVIGSENLASLNLWKDIARLKDLVTFYVVPRPSFTPTNQSELKEYAIEYAPFTGADVSSSLIKTAIAFDKADGLLPPKVLDYINKNGLYQDYKKYTAAFNSFNLTSKPKRIEHTFLAAKYGITLAKIHGEDVEKAITALILHDIAKYADDAVMQKNNVNAGDLSVIPAPCRHAFAGAAVARQYFLIEDEDILNAIKYHTTGRPNMSRLEKIVALADKLEESRGYEGVEELRALSLIDLNKAFALVLKGTIQKLKSQNREIDKLSLNALKYYSKS